MYPDTFSLPCETEIKQAIGVLFTKSKDVNYDEEIDDNKDDHVTGNDEMWIKELDNVICGDKRGKPEKLYNIFL